MNNLRASEINERNVVLDAVEESLHKMQWAAMLTESPERVVGSFETSFVEGAYVIKGVECVIEEISESGNDEVSNCVYQVSSKVGKVRIRKPFVRGNEDQACASLEFGSCNRFNKKTCVIITITRLYIHIYRHMPV